MPSTTPPLSKPLALTLPTPLSFLLYILANHPNTPTTLLIPSDRATFLHSLHLQLHGATQYQRHPAQSPPPSSRPTRPIPGEQEQEQDQEDEGAEEGKGAGEDQGEEEREGRKHRLLTPTLQNLASTSQINIMYMPTLQHLRASIAVYTSAQASNDSDLPSNSTSHHHQQQRPLLALLNPLSLHRHTPQFSAQGLARTFAALVETAHQECVNLLVCECLSASAAVGANNGYRDEHGTESGDWRGLDEGGDMGDGYSLRGEGKGWDEQVPLLDGTVRFGAAGGERWAGRSVSFRRVVGRWFVFEEGMIEVGDGAESY